MPIENDSHAVNGEQSLLEAVQTARDSLGRMAFELDAGTATLPASAATSLKEAQKLLHRLAGEVADGAPMNTGKAFFFDVSDLLGYYPHNRLPTGIQRVQINTILNLLDAPGDWAITLCRFSETRDEWLAVPVPLFRSVCELSIAGGDQSASVWLNEVARLENAVMSGPALAFPKGATLINLGTSWWLPNYFMYIRQAKIASQIRYVPLIHDMIPAMLPDYCNIELVHEFIDWLVGVLQHADFFLAVSESTKADLIRLAGDLGREIPSDQVAVIPLAAELNGEAVKAQAARVSLGKWGLAKGSFVLFVSTVEARKNQIAAFDAWQKLFTRHGKDKIPQLVCVGKKGFGWDRAYARREMSPDLIDKVTILDKVNDAELEALYRNCLFTIYPSLYEGWGLPVTESLCHGKVPVVANNSSLPQAGGGFSVEFETGSVTGFVAALERMMFDDGFRASKEQAIAQRFVARTWRQVAADVERRVGEFAARVDAETNRWRTPVAEPGYYPMTRNRERTARIGIGSAELFRHGNGWWRLEDAGCWTRPSGGELLLRVPAGAARIGVELMALPNHVTKYVISSSDGVLVTGALDPKDRKWTFFDLPAADEERDVLLHFVSNTEEVSVEDEEGNPLEPSRDLGVGLCAFFVFDLANPRARIDFVEAAALGGLGDYKVGLRF